VTESFEINFWGDVKIDDKEKYFYAFGRSNWYTFGFSHAEELNLIQLM
jgi:hypothetical protein